MPLDEQAQAWLTQLEESGLPPLHEMPVDQARQAYSQVATQCGIKPEEVAAVSNRSIPGPHGEIPIRIYVPQGSGPFAVLIYFHGGGWVIGNLEVVHGMCTVLANRAHALVVSVDYRLAPEHRFPAAVDDCFAAIQWVAENAQLINADVERLAVGGDSAGGNLAAVTALMARDRGFPRIMSQLLLYPATDAKSHTPSSTENATGYFLTKDLMQWFYGHYLRNDAEKDDYRVSPLWAKDLGGLPAALIVTAQYDPLRDEGEAYGMRLVEGGNTVTLKRYLGQIHGFCANLAGVMDVGKEALDMAGRFLRESFRAGWRPRSWS